MMDFFNNIGFDLIVFLGSVFIFAIKSVILYVIIKLAIKKALSENQTFTKNEEEKK